MTQHEKPNYRSYSNPAIHDLLQQISDSREDREKGDLLMKKVIDLGKKDIEVLVSAIGFILARLDQRDEAASVLKAIQGIHSKDSFGSDGILHILEILDRDDCGDEED
jgi:hypothetical protein